MTQKVVSLVKKTKPKNKLRTDYLNGEIIAVMQFWGEITMFVSECMFPSQLYSELVNAINNNNNKTCTNIVDVSTHVYVILLEINKKILALTENHRNS